MNSDYEDLSSDFFKLLLFYYAEALYHGSVQQIFSRVSEAVNVEGSNSKRHLTHVSRELPNALLLWNSCDEGLWYIEIVFNWYFADTEKLNLSRLVSAGFY